MRYFIFLQLLNSVGLELLDIFIGLRHFLSNYIAELFSITAQVIKKLYRLKSFGSVLFTPYASNLLDGLVLLSWPLCFNDTVSAKWMTLILAVLRVTQVWGKVQFFIMYIIVRKVLQKQIKDTDLIFKSLWFEWIHNMMNEHSRIRRRKEKYRVKHH